MRRFPIRMITLFATLLLLLPAEAAARQTSLDRYPDRLAHRTAGPNGAGDGRPPAGVGGGSPYAHGRRERRRCRRRDPGHAERGAATDVRDGRERVRDPLRPRLRPGVLAGGHRRRSSGHRSLEPHGRRVEQGDPRGGRPRPLRGLDRASGPLRHDEPGAGSRPGHRLRRRRPSHRGVRRGRDRVSKGTLRELPFEPAHVPPPREGARARRDVPHVRSGEHAPEGGRGRADSPGGRKDAVGSAPGRLRPVLPGRHCRGDGPLLPGERRRLHRGGLRALRAHLGGTPPHHVPGVRCVHQPRRRRAEGWR